MRNKELAKTVTTKDDLPYSVDGFRDDTSTAIDCYGSSSICDVVRGYKCVRKIRNDAVSERDIDDLLIREDGYCDVCSTNRRGRLPVRRMNRGWGAISPPRYELVMWCAYDMLRTS